MTLPTFKTIFSGRLEFGSERTFLKVISMWEHRVLNFYKNDVLLKAEEVLDEETFTLTIPRTIVQTSEKSWRNTISLLEYCSQFAIAGSVSAWMVDSGKMLKHELVEPSSDKVAVQSFLQGRHLVSEKGKENEAYEALSKAIEKFSRHALAYERRGYINFQLGNTKDALYDFTKSIDINPAHPDAYMGRAIVYVEEEKFEEARADLEMAVKTSIPHQPVYWQARRMKGECHLELKEFDKALFDLKLVNQRKFNDSDPNFKWQSRAAFNFGRALLAKGNYEEAIEAFTRSANFEANENILAESEPILMRGIAMQKAGKPGYLKEFQKAADKGSRRAASLLAGTQV